MEANRRDHRQTGPRPGDRSPAWDDLEASPRFGEEEVGLDIAGLRVRLHGLSVHQASWFGARYGVFAENGLGRSPHVTFRVGRAPADGFLSLGSSGGPELYRLAQEVLPGGFLRAWSYRFAGWFSDGERRGRLWLSDAAGREFESSLENFLRVTYATLALRGGGFLLHSAGIVREGRAYLLFGPSGSGKTTACRLSPGERVVSDDLVLVLPDGENPGGVPRAMSVPFRGLYAELPRKQESFPVAGFFRLVQDAQVYLEPLGRPRGASEIIGSLPFVTDEPENGEAILDAVGAALTRVPAYRLHFRKDPGFWSVLEGESAGAEGQC